MNSKVRVVADKNGNVITVSSNEEFGYIRVVQDTTNFTAKGWIEERQLSALVHGRLEMLLKQNFSEGQELNGKIVVKESLTPFDGSTDDRDLKYAGATGIPCLLDDQPIYRRTFYTENQQEESELVQHNNSEMIRERIAEMKVELKHVRGPIFEVASF